MSVNSHVPGLGHPALKQDLWSHVGECPVERIAHVGLLSEAKGIGQCTT